MTGVSFVASAASNASLCLHSTAAEAQQLQRAQEQGRRQTETHQDNLLQSLQPAGCSRRVIVANAATAKQVGQPVLLRLVQSPATST